MMLYNNIQVAFFLKSDFNTAFVLESDSHVGFVSSREDHLSIEILRSKGKENAISYFRL